MSIPDDGYAGGPGTLASPLVRLEPHGTWLDGPVDIHLPLSLSAMQVEDFQDPSIALLHVPFPPFCDTEVLGPLLAFSASGAVVQTHAPSEAVPDVGYVPFDIEDNVGGATYDLLLSFQFEAFSDIFAEVDDIVLDPEALDPPASPVYRPCRTDADCSDGSSCSIDECEETVYGSLCGYTLLMHNEDCDDGNPNTVEDMCISNRCVDTPVECTDGDPTTCDDGNLCTADTCSGMLCRHEKLTGTTCDDGHPETLNDVCGMGTCLGTENPCSYDAECDDGDLRTTDTCQFGACMHGYANGITCDDGDPYTERDACFNGECGGWVVGCMSDAECDDGDECAINDRCVAMAGTARDC